MGQKFSGRDAVEPAQAASSRRETDRDLPRIDAAARLARALGVGLDELAVFNDEQGRSRPKQAKGR